MKGRRLCFAIALGASVLAAGTARAHGRFPESRRVVEDPTNPDRIVIGATFGLLVSDDRGASFRHVCKSAFVGSEDDSDVLLEVLPDGTLLAGAAGKLSRSTGCACAFEDGRPGAADFVIDLASARDGRVFVLSSSSASGRYLHRVSVSDDSGKSYRLASELSELALASSLRLAPSDPNRVYVAGYTASGAGVLGTSHDAGQTFAFREIPDASVDRQPYVLGVHPTDPGALFLVTRALTELAMPNERVSFSRDAGERWTPAIEQSAALLGFAWSPDGSSVLLGFGDRVDPAVLSDYDAMGVYRAAFGDEPVFERVVTGAVSCLDWTPSGLYTCLTEYHPDFVTPFAVGLADDARFPAGVAEPMRPVLRHRDVTGPSACLTETCGAVWESDMCRHLRASCVPAEPSETSCEAPRPSQSAKSSAGCAFSPRNPARGAWLWPLALLVCRRRRRRCPDGVPTGTAPAR